MGVALPAWACLGVCLGLGLALDAFFLRFALGTRAFRLVAAAGFSI